MFAYLSKRLMLSEDSTIHSMSWNKNTDCLGVGGAKGLLKVVVLKDSHDPYQAESDKKK